MCDRDEFEKWILSEWGEPFHDFHGFKNGEGWSYSDHGLNAVWIGYCKGQAARAQQPNLSRIAQKKIDQMGATVHGVLVKNEAGAWAAVSDAGRVMWLDGFESQACRSGETEKAGG